MMVPLRLLCIRQHSSAVFICKDGGGGYMLYCAYSDLAGFIILMHKYVRTDQDAHIPAHQAQCM